jgi:hypothetical protein
MDKKGGNPIIRNVRRGVNRLGKINADKAFEETLSFMSSLYSKIDGSLKENDTFIDQYAYAKTLQNKQKLTHENVIKNYNTTLNYLKNKQSEYLYNNPQRVQNINGNVVIELNNKMDEIIFNYDNVIDIRKIIKYFKTPIKKRREEKKYVIINKKGKKTISRIKPSEDYKPKKLIF